MRLYKKNKDKNHPLKNLVPGDILKFTGKNGCVLYFRYTSNEVVEEPKDYDCEIDIAELLENAKKDKANYDEYGNRIAMDADSFY